MEGAGAAQSPASFSSAVSPVVAFSAFLEACGNKATAGVRTGAGSGTAHGHRAGSGCDAAHPRDREEAPAHRVFSVAGWEVSPKRDHTGPGRCR